MNRTTPASEETEHGFLAIALLDPRKAFQAAAEISLTREDFYFPSTGMLFDVMQEFWHANEPLDGSILTVILRDRKCLNETGGRIRGQSTTGEAFIIELETLMPTVHVVDAYAEIIKRKSARRKAIDRLGSTMESAYDTAVEDVVFLAAAENSLMDIVRMREGQKMHTRSMKELVIRAMQRIDDRLHGNWRIEMPTGIKALDKATLGFKAPMVTMVLGKPSDGKSSLSMNIAENLAINHGKKVGIISMDDSDDQLADRLIQARAGVSRWEIEQTGQLSGVDRELLMSAAREIGEAPIYIRDDGGLTPAEISATFTAWKAKHGLDFGIIDHIQLAQSGEKSDSRTSAAEQVSRTLKPMAKRLNIPLLVLSQVTEESPGHYVTKNTRALGEDANNVWTLARAADSTDAWITISKQKDGPRGIKVPVKYEQAFTRFSDREKEPDAEQLEIVNMGNGKKPAGRRK